MTIAIGAPMDWVAFHRAAVALPEVLAGEKIKPEMPVPATSAS